jgi:hypothetical protein
LSHIVDKQKQDAAGICKKNDGTYIVREHCTTEMEGWLSGSCGQVMKIPGIWNSTQEQSPTGFYQKNH